MKDESLNYKVVRGAAEGWDPVLQLFLFNSSSHTVAKDPLISRTEMPHGSSTIYLLALVRVLQCHAHRAAPTAVSEQSGLVMGRWIWIVD